MYLPIKIFLTSFILSFILNYFFIKILKKINKNKQPIRFLKREFYLIKKNTPTMGGLVILICSFLSMFFWIQLTSEIILLISITLFFGIIGFIDDYQKLKTNSYKGLSAKTKIFFQLIVTIISIYIFKICYFNKIFEKTSLLKEIINKNFFSYLYMIFTMFIIIGYSNAVNITDGLDGLAATQSITSFIFLGLIAYIDQVDINIILSCIAFTGSILGFLWFNIYPAKIFMGDTGSLSIGAALGLISILIKKEIFFAFIGGIIFVIETLSVIIQVLYFKYTKFIYGSGKRIFLMSPIHHHFEKSGLSETEIVIKFWIINIIFSIIGINFFLKNT